MTIEIKPCPFCGTVPHSYQLNLEGKGTMHCSTCNMDVNFYGVRSIGGVRHRWNKRSKNGDGIPSDGLEEEE